MDTLEQIKQHARTLRHHIDNFVCTKTKVLKQGHALEIAVALLTDKDSWNHCVAEPPSFVGSSPNGDINEHLNSLCRGLYRSREFDIPLYGELDDQLAGQALDESISAMGLMPLSKLIEREGVMQDEGGHRYHLNNSSSNPPISHLLRDWIDRSQANEDLSTWDEVEKLAIRMGFSDDEAALIRLTQREFWEYEWSWAVGFIIGTLDPDKPRFLEYLRKSEGWKKVFHGLMATDGREVVIDGHGLY